MRFKSCFAGLCAAILFGQAAIAAEPLPQRWVSAGGSVSEWIVELGGQAKLVGVDTTSQHPAELKALPSIGYQRQLAAEGILSLKPDLLVGTEEMGPPPVLEQLKAAGVRIEALSAKADVQTLEHNLQRLGELLGDQPRATQVLADYRQRLDQQAAWVTAAQRSQAAPRVMLLLGHAGGRPMAAGKDTAAAWLIERAGGQNVTPHNGYKAISTEALMALDPQVVIFTDRALSGDAAKQALLKENPALAATRAARDGRLVALDPTLLVGGLGPRLPEGLAQLSKAFYPDVHADAKP
ncbi:Hemin-binding periplasmic protein HmuT [compost metagenome]